MSRFRFTATKRYGVLLGLAAGSLLLGGAASASASSASHHDSKPAEKCKIVRVEVGDRANAPSVPAKPGKPGTPADEPGVPAKPGTPADEPGQCVILVDQHGNRVTPVGQVEDGQPSKTVPTTRLGATRP
ncbi:hypothetical protein [Streptomyces hygroscopicus]|uniref:hypothetical protein n=1 Tax=Streptomyces hygroscopicus TaxID=1912 RepID=UPI0036B37ECC